MTTIAFDTETCGLNWFDPEEQVFLVSWADADGAYHADLNDTEGLQRFMNALEAADTLVCHNLSFDVHQVRASLGWDALHNGHALQDTDIMSRVMYPEGQRDGDRGGHGLKNLAKVHLRADAEDAEDVIKEMAKSIGVKLKAKNGYYDTWRAYPEEMERYARDDARFTYDLYEKFSADLGGDAKRIYELERQVAPILIRAEERGVAIDQDAVAELKGVYGPQESELHARLTKELGGDALGGKGSEEALLEALQAQGIPLHRKTDTGKLSTSKYALQEFEDDYPVIADLMEWRRLVRFLDTYLAPMEDAARFDSVLHTSFVQCGAWTGRMSSRRPNLQNLPKRAGKEVRKPIVPREGYKLVAVDYEAIEVRLLAYYLADQGYRDLIAQGHDPHAWMAACIHGGEMKDYVKDSDNRDLRDVAKNTTFAITYGAGAPRVADMNKISKDEAKALISQITSSLPRYRRLKGRINKRVRTAGHVKTLMGRKQPVKKDKSYVGLNALIQGSAADIMKQGLVYAEEAIKEYGAHPLLVVHDELVMEAPAENAERVMEVAGEALCAAAEIDPPLAVEGSIADNYADA